MKIAILIVLSALASAQVQVTVDPPYLGACSNNPPLALQFNTANGKLWGCSGTPPVWNTIPPQTTSLLTGTHWPASTDFTTVKNVGLGFAVVTVPDIPTLTADLAAASAAGIKLIVGLWPPPYTLNPDNATWTISALGNTFLQNLAANASSVLGVYVFNEPYYTGNGSSQNACGVYTAAQLRQLRTQIQGVWSGAKIYQDIGDPQAWVQGGSVWTPCVGTKYADQTNVADFVGIWYYPFSSANAYGQTALTAFVNRVAPFVKSSMTPAASVFLAQSFAAGSGSAGDGSSAIMPSGANMKSLNCTLRTMLPTGSLISWYVWIQASYSDYLKNHSELWPNAPASACQ